MTTEVLLKLLDAGYSKDEISLMKEVETNTEVERAAEETADNEQTEEITENEQTEEIENPSMKMTETINEIMQIITKMQKTLDGMQQKNAKMATTELPERTTADEVIRSFFAKKEEKGG